MEENTTPQPIQDKKERSRSGSKSRNSSSDSKKDKKDTIKNFNDLLEEFKKPRDELLFKVSFENGLFYEMNAKKYLTSIINNQEAEIIEYKMIKMIRPKEEIFLYFKLNKKICLRKVYFQSSKKGDLPRMKISQLRPNYFFIDNF